MMVHLYIDFYSGDEIRRENHHIGVLRCAVGVKACFMRGWVGGVG